MLTKEQINILLKNWYQDWNNHDLDKVMAPFHDDIVFIHWNGTTIAGKRKLKMAWKPWFDKHDNFSFTEIETLIDETQQKAVFRWILDWVPHKIGNAKPSSKEKRAGLDVLHFHENKIIRKITFSRVEDGG